MKRPRSAATLAVALVLALARTSGLAAQDDHDHAHARDGDAAAVSLYDGLGSHHRAITTPSADAQAWFDQGLRWQFGFNHAEAIRSYREALRHDDACAMCWWGIALAAGPNINAPMDEAGGRLAWEAIGEARRRAAGTSAEERALIEALAVRYAEDPASPRAPLDSAYARAMGTVAAAHPDDADILTLHAAALMNLSPWMYWEGPYEDRVPRPGTPGILASLQRALEIDAQNPGACHYYIHAVEAAFPERAVECAERLAALMPGAGHVVHMPGHVYVRVGRYHDAVVANDHAVHADETWMGDSRPGTLYSGAYYPHNYHFMSFAASMAGMGDKAMEAARIVSTKVPKEVALQIYWIQNVLVLPQLTAVTFGRWEEALDAPMPDPELTHATMMAHYARGTALAALGRMDEARAELARVQAAADAVEGPAEVQPVPAIAAHSLAGEIALRGGKPDEAVAHFRAAAELEDGMLYEEPPVWYYPVRHSLGRALLEAGRAAEAEAAYRQDLARFRENGWSLFGLARALEAQGRHEEAAAARARFEAAWKHADVELTASRI